MPTRSFRRASTPNLEWSDFSDVEIVVVGPSTKTLLAGHTASVALDLTILRIRLQLAVKTDQVAAGEIQAGAFGCIVVTDDAFAAGVSAIPGPISDAAADWMLYHPFWQFFAFSDATGFQHNAGNSMTVDSKAKRVIEPNETLAIVVESNSDSEGFSIGFQGRILTRLRGTR